MCSECVSQSKRALKSSLMGMRACLYPSSCPLVRSNGQMSTSAQHFHMLACSGCHQVHPHPLAITHTQCKAASIKLDSSMSPYSGTGGNPGSDFPCVASVLWRSVRPELNVFMLDMALGGANVVRALALQTLRAQTQPSKGLHFDVKVRMPWVLIAQSMVTYHLSKRQG